MSFHGSSCLFTTEQYFVVSVVRGSFAHRPRKDVLGASEFRSLGLMLLQPPRAGFCVGVSSPLLSAHQGARPLGWVVRVCLVL